LRKVFGYLVKLLSANRLYKSEKGQSQPGLLYKSEQS